MYVRNTEITVIKGDLTALDTDAIVNAANNKLVMGGGVAGAIKRKGGAAIEEEALKKGPIAIGEAAATSGGKLRARYVIHAATMGMDFATDEAKIRASCKSALNVAESLTITSVAFPALGCGVGGFDLKDCAKIMAQEAFTHLRDGKSVLKRIVFCLYDDEAFAVFEKTVTPYLEHLTEKLQEGPFVTVDAIIERDGAVVLIRRKNPPLGWALPGGFVDYGESVETAAAREVKEETALDVTALQQFHVYSDPGRDPRFHTVGVVFTASAEGTPKAGDDAAGAEFVPVAKIRTLEFAFDHGKILKDYLAFREGKSPFAGPGERRECHGKR